ncbi:HTH domain-containing protein [Chitinophaga sp.]|uniref:HTH domain-containing protein n=1 Tax=Chitinophaga sp. TaxID=1869181 RepID=UPI00261DED46|nr:HTH domain-containing protein [uncultured Chitinophaga sp.]
MQENTKLTFLKLAEQTLEKANTPLSPPDIWLKAKEFGLTEKFRTSGKTPQNSIGAQLYVDVRDNPSSVFIQTSKRPSTFGLKRISYASNKLPDNSIEGNPSKTPKFNERNLHPSLVKFAYSHQHFKAHLKTIYHELSSKQKKGLNKWLHPDVVGVYFPFSDYEKETLHLQQSLSVNSIKLFSFEIKIEITLSNLRQYFFQAVSNSSWANEAYLVVAKIEDDEALTDEIRRLNNAFGIGIIKLNPTDIYSSEILFPSRLSSKIDWDTVDRLVAENNSFKSFINDITDDVKLRQVKSTYDTVLSDDEYDSHVLRHNIYP